MSEQNKAFVRHLMYEVIGKGNFALVDELVAEDYVGHTPFPETNTREGHKQFFVALRHAFPDLQVTVEEQLAEGDKVVTRFTASGTHKGEFAGIPPTGKRAVMTGIDIDRIANGKLVECWSNTDDLGLMQQLGVVPAPGQIA
jgi:steroid delta-isomerase-like uncharacterized protein